MTWMNEHEITEAWRRLADDPVVGPAVQTLANLVDWTNSNSDGWPYYRGPANAASSLMTLVQARMYNLPASAIEVTAETVAKALRPVKAFRTRQGADFTIVEPAQGCIRGM